MPRSHHGFREAADTAFGDRAPSHRRWRMFFTLASLGVLLVGHADGQRGRRWSGYYEVPAWEVNEELPDDVFTFVRIRYDSLGYRGGGWRTDYHGRRASSELNFSLRLQQLTTLRVNPQPVVLELNDPRLFDYPFIYIVETGRPLLSPE